MNCEILLSIDKI